MIAYKAFNTGLNCRGYQFHMGLNTTDKANCAQNGFHCAANPLDCLSYYSMGDQTEFYIVNAGGDIDEDACDSKIACTELTILKKLDLWDFVVHALAYLFDHPRMKPKGWFELVKSPLKINRRLVVGVKGDLLDETAPEILAAGAVHFFIAASEIAVKNLP